jgi:hypothetical protein
MAPFLPDFVTLAFAAMSLKSVLMTERFAEMALASTCFSATRSALCISCAMKAECAGFAWCLTLLANCHLQGVLAELLRRLVHYKAAAMDPFSAEGHLASPGVLNSIANSVICYTSSSNCTKDGQFSPATADIEL